MRTQEEFYLKAESRKAHGKGVARKLRAAGFIPAVLYGDKQPPQMLTLNQKDFEYTLQKIAGESVLISLHIEGSDETEQVFIKEAQRHPVTDHIIHADLFRVPLTKKIRIEVPVHPAGKAVGVKKGGILETLTRSIEIKCLPTRIPQHIEVDISELEVHHSVHVRDITLEPEIEVLTPLDTALFTIVPPKIEVEAPKEEEEGALIEGEKEIAEPEVIGKGKETKEESGEAKKEEKD